MKNRLKIIAIVLLFVNLVCSFMPCYFTMNIQRARDSWSGIYQPYASDDYSFLGIINAIGSSGSKAPMLIILLWITVIVVLLIFIFQNKNNYMSNLLPAISLIPFLLVVRSTASFYQFVGQRHYAVDVSWMFYISFALQVVAAVLMIFANKKEIASFTSVAPNTIPETSIPSQQYDAIDEIKKYKDLLDDGIITQEEFEIKKKQLLDI